MRGASPTCLKISVAISARGLLQCGVVVAKKSRRGISGRIERRTFPVHDLVGGTTRKYRTRCHACDDQQAKRLCVQSSDIHGAILGGITEHGAGSSQESSTYGMRQQVASKPEFPLQLRS
jgi:hypothetical protein